MQEIKIKNNELNIPVYIEELPDLTAIPETDLHLLITELELYIYEYMVKKAKGKKKAADARPP